jgi:hypothetical protein
VAAKDRHAREISPACLCAYAVVLRPIETCRQDAGEGRNKNNPTWAYLIFWPSIWLFNINQRIDISARMAKGRVAESGEKARSHKASHGMVEKLEPVLRG